VTKPLASLRDRPLAQHALVMAYKRALEKQEKRTVKETVTVDPQLRLELEAK